MAKTTAIAIGLKRIARRPLRKTTGTKTMQIVRVETKVGQRSAARRRGWRVCSVLPMPRLRWMFSISTVALSTRMPTARASRRGSSR